MTKNMRVLASGDERLIEWDNLITSIGNGTCGTGPDGDIVTFPPDMCMRIEENTSTDKNRESKSMMELTEKVFPDLKDNISVPNWLDGRAILTPTNKSVDGINDMIVASLPNPDTKLYSADQVDDLRDSRGFSVEHMNRLNPNGMPRHCIALKPSVPLMLMRNIEPSNGLCNGSRLIYKGMSSNNRLMICDYTVFGATREVTIPRIILKPKDTEFPFDWSRRQFPVRVAFACTVNKSQGQTMKRVGVWLPAAVFGHGQLYVAVSRVGDPNNCTIAIKPVSREAANSTRNVVFKEVLLGCVSGAQQQQPQPPPPAPVQPPVVVVEEEIDPEWLDYDGIEDVPHGGDFEEEFGVPCNGPVPRPVEPLTRLTPRVPRNAGPLPPMEPDILPPLPQGEMSEYELIREDNINELRAQWLEVFGEEYPRVGGDYYSDISDAEDE